MSGEPIGDARDLARASATAPGDRAPGDRAPDGRVPGFNYYNYFTEVEEAFVRRRGAHMLVSPLDWALIETWKDVGVPLHIVLRGIEQSFDSFDAQPRRHRRVNSIFYCQQEIESCYAEYRRALVGSAEIAPGAQPEGPNANEAARPGAAPVPSDADNPFPRARVERYLREGAEEIATARARAESRGLAPLAAEIARVEERLEEIVASLGLTAAMNAEGLERDLTALEDVLAKAIAEHAPPEEVEGVRDEAKAQLKAYKKTMDKAIYAQTFEKLVARRLREIHRLPRLSLFFMN